MQMTHLNAANLIEVIGKILSKSVKLTFGVEYIATRELRKIAF